MYLQEEMPCMPRAGQPKSTVITSSLSSSSSSSLLTPKASMHPPSLTFASPFTASATKNKLNGLCKNFLGVQDLNK